MDAERRPVKLFRIDLVKDKAAGPMGVGSLVVSNHPIIDKEAVYRIAAVAFDGKTVPLFLLLGRCEHLNIPVRPILTTQGHVRPLGDKGTHAYRVGTEFVSLAEPMGRPPYRVTELVDPMYFTIAKPQVDCLGCYWPLVSHGRMLVHDFAYSYRQEEGWEQLIAQHEVWPFGRSRR